MINPTLEICHLANEISCSKISKNIINKSKLLLKDGLGVMLAGMKHPTIKLLSEHIKELECKPVSPIYGYNFSSSPQEAAFINGAATHVLDFEPMFNPPTHVVSPILSGILALAYYDNREFNGEKFLEAFIAGVQFQADLRKAAHVSDHIANKNKNHFPFQKQGFHPPGTVGALGSALASGIWIGLNNEQLSMALGISASRSSGIAGNIGTMTKSSHCGHAARVGVESALLARRGFTASLDTIGGPSGWGDVYGGKGFDINMLKKGMSLINCFDDPGFAFKKWPTHTAMQIAINSAIPLYKSDYIPKKVEIATPIFKYCNRPFPKDSDDARFSFQYNVALGILDGQVDFDSYTSNRLNSNDMTTLLSRISLTMDSNIISDFNEMEVKIILDDGRSSESDRWPGHWKSPASEIELKNKFIKCASQLYNKENTELLNDSLDNIESISSFKKTLSILGKMVTS